ncbi:MAG: hypothetical protein ACTH5W_15005 [Providencia sp.]|uniref:hypothetical protein n=1 Tax=Providencia sp. TaxID=589 RepID=UPI003F9ABDFE
MVILSKKYKKDKHGVQFIFENGSLASTIYNTALSKEDINSIIDLVETAYSRGISVGRKEKTQELREFLEE